MSKLPFALVVLASCAAAPDAQTVIVGGAPDNGTGGGDMSGENGAGSSSGSGSGSGSGSDTASVSGCELPWGGRVEEGASVTAYGDPVVVGSQYDCPSEHRTCTDSKLSGVLANASCGSAPTHCELPWGGSIAIGQSVTAYRQLYSPHCTDSATMETRTCGANGLLSGTAMNIYPTCAADGANDCVVGGHLVPYHTSMTVYPSSHPSFGSCTPHSVTCVKGDTPGIVLSGAYNDRFTTCATGPTDCSSTQTADLTTPEGLHYTRRCASNVIVDHNNGAVAYSTDLTAFGEVFGFPAISDTFGWPGAFPGFTPTMTLSEHEFVSLAFTAGPARTVNVIPNPSYSMPVSMTISRRPGAFSPTDPDVVCSATGIITSSGWPGGASCVLSSDPGITYYINMAPYPGTDCSATGGQCSIGLAVYYVY